MPMAGDVSAPHSNTPSMAKPASRARTSPARRALRHVSNTLGYSLARKDQDHFDCPSVPVPSAEIVERAAGTFANSFPISPKCGLSEEEVGRRIKDYFWHYPFEFGNHFVEATDLNFRGL